MRVRCTKESRTCACIVHSARSGDILEVVPRGLYQVTIEGNAEIYLVAYEPPKSRGRIRLETLRANADGEFIWKVVHTAVDRGVSAAEEAIDQGVQE